MKQLTNQPTWIELFTPKLITVLRDGYNLKAFQSDAVAGLTVSIVALPLSIALAIASHAPPEAGLYTAIIGGFLISALGGSRFQIGGPAGAFIVLIASIIDRHGFDGLLLATLMGGVIIFVVGLLKFGTYIRYVPYPVTVGFTAGIAIIIFASQVRDLFGLTLTEAEPSALVPKIQALWQVGSSFNAHAAAIAGLSIIIVVSLRKIRPHWPGFLIAITVASVAAWALSFDVETVHSKFGGIPRSLPVPSLPSISLEKIRTLLPDALAIALLGSIESLLSAVVADSMTGRRHRSNCELVAQGIANMACSMFGGITATGTIARTATNVRAGAHGPVAGMLHSAFLLLFMAAAAPLAGFIPLSALAGILAIVAWHMAEKAEFRSLLTSTPGDAAVLLVTFGLTIFQDLITGIVVGVVLGCLLFMHRMAEAMEIRTHRPVHSVGEDRADNADGPRTPYDAASATDPDIVIYRITGAFFFGAASTVAATLERIGEPPKGFILDMTRVPFVDYSAAHSLRWFLKSAGKHGAIVYLTGALPQVRKDLIHYGIKKPVVHYGHSIDACIKAIRRAV